MVGRAARSSLAMLFEVDTKLYGEKQAPRFVEVLEKYLAYMVETHQQTQDKRNLKLMFRALTALLASEPTVGKPLSAHFTHALNYMMKYTPDAAHPLFVVTHTLGTFVN